MWCTSCEFCTVLRIGPNEASIRALGLLTEHTARFAPIVTHSRPLDEIGGAFAQLENYADGAGKIVIAFPK
jgi:threonine dehydrogenase-like Zn-dependent dehydrogenase